MPEIGRTISHYRIVEKLGAGGMGVVYRAEDSNLERQVAIKLLPDAFIDDPERLARFEREAKLLASLNHPNIAAIHGLEVADGRHFLVLELVEGQTLAQKLSKTALPLEETLEICRQIAEGLEAAHEKGIVHRDLKPANVMITPQGKVKILDFGLAKALADETHAIDSTHSPTITEGMTRPGVVLGTATYMSPEQARGRSVDKRADIWAFGCILYECLAGKRAFHGETVTETIAKILEGAPEWQALPGNTPAIIRSLLQWCLQKDPRHRFHDIGDVRIEITEALSQPMVAESPHVSKVHRTWIAIALISAFLIVGSAASIITWHLKSPPAASIVRTMIDLPAGMQLTRDRKGPTRTELALSPDGRHLIFSASPDGSESKARLYLRAMNRMEGAPISGTEGARSPFFSPDGQWVGFWAQGKLQKVSLGGGIPIPLCGLDEIPMGASWGSNDRIIIGTLSQGLQSIDAGGGKPEVLITPEPTTEATYRLPYLLPGGKAVVFTVMPHLWGTCGQIEVLSLESRKRKVLVEEGMDARLAGTAHLVYVREGTLMAAPFDPDRLEIRGPAVPVVEGVMQAANETWHILNSGAGQFSYSHSGSLVYASGGTFPDPQRQLTWVDRQGMVQPMTSLGERAVLSPRLSPDGQKLAFTTNGRDANLWLYDLARGTSSRLTTAGRTFFLTWTPDGSRIVFSYSLAGAENIFSMPWDGSGSIERLMKAKAQQCPGSWSQDGRFLAFAENDDIWIFRMDDRQAVPFINTKFIEGCPDFSRDGQWLAYASNESGRSEVYVTSFPGSGKRITISNEGGQEPIWAKNGRELFYWNAELEGLMVVDVVTQPAFRVGTPRLLFKFPYEGMMPGRSYDVTADDRRFLMYRDAGIKPAEVACLKMVLNWFEELKRLVPTGK